MLTNRLTQVTQPVIEESEVVAPRRRIQTRRLRHALNCATRGLHGAWVSQPNLRIHGYFGCALAALGLVVRLSLTGWLWLAFAIGLVLFAELMNTAIESTVDLVVGLRPDPLARQIKDIAAGCVLVATILAVVIESFVFIPHLLWG